MDTSGKALLLLVPPVARDVRKPKLTKAACFSDFLYPQMFRRTRKVFKKVVLAKATTNLVLPVLAVLPPSILTATKMPNPWPAWFFAEVNGTLASYPQLQTIGAFWPWIVVALGFFLSRFRDWCDEDSEISAKELTCLLRTLDTPVGKKLKRFGKAAVSLKKNGRRNSEVSCETVFLDITRPDEQLSLLTESIYLFFMDDVETSDDLRVILARMKKEKVAEFAQYLPHGTGPRSRIENLQGENVTFNYAAKLKQMVIVEDIAKELRKKQGQRYAPGESEAENTGSIICYPVIDHACGEIPYVISVKYSEPRHFTNARRQRYEYILKRFAERIALEHNLTQIKEAMTRDQNRS